MESNKRNELQKYKEAKIMFNIALVISKSTLSNGSLDISRYKELIENEYKRKIAYIQEKIKEKSDLAKLYQEKIKDIEEYFKLA